jgi:hypothetical protein
MNNLTQWTPLFSSIMLVMLLHAVVNILNRYVNALLMLDEDCDIPSSDVFSCSLLVFLALMWLLASSQHKTRVKKYGLALIQAELLLQGMHIVFMCRLFSLRLCDILPILGDSHIGCLNLFKTLFVLWSGHMAIKMLMNFLNKKPNSDSCCEPCPPPECKDIGPNLAPPPQPVQYTSQNSPYNGSCSSSSNISRSTPNCCRPTSNMYVPPRRTHCGDS